MGIFLSVIKWLFIAGFGLCLLAATGTGEVYYETVREYGMEMAGPSPWDKEVTLYFVSILCALGALATHLFHNGDSSQQG